MGQTERTVAFHDFKDGTGAAVYGMMVFFESPAARAGGVYAIKAMPSIGAFDPVIPPEAAPVGNGPPNCDGDSRFGQASDGGEYRTALALDNALGDLDPKACAAGVCGASD